MKLYNVTINKFIMKIHMGIANISLILKKKKEHFRRHFFVIQREKKIKYLQNMVQIKFCFISLDTPALNKYWGIDLVIITSLTLPLRRQVVQLVINNPFFLVLLRIVTSSLEWSSSNKTTQCLQVHLWGKVYCSADSTKQVIILRVFAMCYAH